VDKKKDEYKIRFEMNRTLFFPYTQQQALTKPFYSLKIIVVLSNLDFDMFPSSERLICAVKNQSPLFPELISK